MKKISLTSYKQKKKACDKRKFKRVYNMEMPTFMFYMANIPRLIIQVIWCLVKENDISKPFYDLVKVAKIRKQVIYYKKKQGDTSEKVKFRYYVGELYIEVQVYFGRKITVTEYEHLIESCATITEMQHSELSRKNGYYAFQLYTDPVPVKQVVVDKENHRICVGQDYRGSVMWDFDVFSCALIAGKPRNGKSSVIMYLLNSLVEANWDIYIIDGKDVDYVAYREYFKGYVGNDALIDVIILIEQFHQKMVERYQLMRDHKVNKYIKLGLNPIFLICDEYLSVIERIKKECIKAEYEKVMYMIGDIVRRGPAGGIQLVLGMQRADTVYIPGEVRSNIQLKIVVGDGGNDLYKMMFEDESDICTSLEVGHAWYRMGARPLTMAIPFYDTIEKVQEHETA